MVGHGSKTILYRITPEDTAALIGFVLTGVPIDEILLDDEWTSEKMKYIEHVNDWLMRRKRPTIKTDSRQHPAGAISLDQFLKEWGWGPAECRAALYMANL